MTRTCGFLPSTLTGAHTPMPLSTKSSSTQETCRLLVTMLSTELSMFPHAQSSSTDTRSRDPQQLSFTELTSLTQSDMVELELTSTLMLILPRRPPTSDMTRMLLEMMVISPRSSTMLRLASLTWMPLKPTDCTCTIRPTTNK